MSESSVDELPLLVGSPPDSPPHHEAILKEGELFTWEFIQSEVPSTSTHAGTWAWLSDNEREKENFNRTRAEQLWPAGSSSNSLKSLSIIDEEDQEDMRSYLPRDSRPKSIRPPGDPGHAKNFDMAERTHINEREFVILERVE